MNIQAIATQRTTRMLLLIGMLLTPKSSGVTLQWTPPFGIPAPGFGIAEQAPPPPAAWPGAEASGNYYIDNTHPNATDKSNTYGYPNKPRMTVPDSMLLGANSLSQILGGPYACIPKHHVIQIDPDPKNPPRRDAPAFIRGIPQAAGTVIGVAQEVASQGLDARIEIGSRNLSYAIIENMAFHGLSVNVVGKDTHHIALRNCEVKGAKTSLISAYPSDGGTMHNLVFYQNFLHESFGWADDATNCESHGINISLLKRSRATSLHDIWVLDNNINNCGGDGVLVNGDSAGHAQVHHVYIGRNKAHENRQSGIWCKQADHVIVSQNVISDMREHGPHPGDGAGYQGGPDNLWFLFNDIYQCNYGIRQSDTQAGAESHSAFIVGNHIHDLNQAPKAVHQGSPSGWGISFWTGGMNRHVVDNTIANVHGGIQAFGSGPVLAQNNIIFNLKPNVSPETLGQYCNHIECSDAKEGAIMTFANCLIYGQIGGNAQQARIKWLGVQYTSLPAAQNAVGTFPMCIEMDPLLSGVRLQPNSRAIDAGAQSEVYQRFENLYGFSIPMSINGLLRPSGAGPDIGAYEFDPGSPGAPTLRRIQQMPDHPPGSVPSPFGPPP